MIFKRKAAYMKLAILFFYFLALSVTAFSDEREANIQNKIKNELGSCYDNFTSNLNDCISSVCAYPDLNDSKAWRAQTIKGYYNDSCYVIYYSYIGSQVLGSPDHCFYSKVQQKTLTGYYRQLLTARSSVIAGDAKTRIATLNESACQKAPNTSQVK